MKKMAKKLENWAEFSKGPLSMLMRKLRISRYFLSQKRNIFNISWPLKWRKWPGAVEIWSKRENWTFFETNGRKEGGGGGLLPSTPVPTAFRDHFLPHQLALLLNGRKDEIMPLPVGDERECAFRRPKNSTAIHKMNRELNWNWPKW